MKIKTSIFLIVCSVIISSFLTWKITGSNISGCSDSAVPLNEVSNIEIGGLNFTLPADWSLLSTEKYSEKSPAYQSDYENATRKWEVAKISVPDSTYDVVIPMDVRSFVGTLDVNITPVVASSDNVTIYEDVCAPSLACYVVVKDNNAYHVTFEGPESNQPAPENLDGVWFPDTEVTKSQLLELVSTVK